MLDEERDVRGAIAERGDGERHDREAVVQIESKCPCVDLAPQISVGRCDDAEIDFDLTAASDTTEPPALKRAEQIGLELGGQLADLIEEQGTAMGELKGAALGSVRTGKRSLFVAEELARDERGSERAAIDGDEWRVGPSARVVDGARDELLPRTRLPAHEYRNRPRSELPNIAHEAPHGARRTAQVAQTILGVKFNRQGQARLDREARLTDLDQRTRRRDAALHADAVDRRPVLRTEILDLNPGFHCREPRVVAGHGWIGEYEIVVTGGPERGDLRLESLSLVHARAHGGDHSAHGHRVAKLERRRPGVASVRHGSR
ncbi:MAG: hypothetical protein U0414_37705 [Polyangiaceae bacterium]